MTFTTLDRTPRLGTDNQVDRETALRGKRATQPQIVHRHPWKVGDLLVWENTGVMHRVLTTLATADACLHRTTLVGKAALA